MTDPQPQDPYVMRISRMTVDKLGVCLYDRVSAVVAELVANAYDADAETVVVRLPLATLLARRDRVTKQVQGFDYYIEVKDDGHGMTPTEANDHFLRVGKDRRSDAAQGGRSRDKRRSVMGRKGIGKLAPFGICRRIEVLSAGGPKTKLGHIVSHFVMDYTKILRDEDEPVAMEVGAHDRTYRPTPGTVVKLFDFLPKRVPNSETFHRQMARRFGLQQQQFAIRIRDTRNPAANPPFEIGTLDIPLMQGTRVDVSEEPVTLSDRTKLPVSGWMGLAKEAYKNEEMAGVRVYARGKIVATTRDFEQPAGFTGEFTLRSYLVGEIHAEWLDEDDGDILSVAPHKALMDAFGDFNRVLFGEEQGIDSLLDLFSKTRIAEMASYAQIARERVGAIRRLEEVIRDDGAEDVLQGIVAKAPWLIAPTWTPITKNQSLNLFARTFEDYYEKKHRQEVVLAIDHGTKRPDFTLISVSQGIHIVEIKAAGHRFGNKDWDRLHNYLDAFEAFSGKHEEVMKPFPGGWVVDLICDHVRIANRDKKVAYKHWKGEGRIRRTNWRDFLARAVQANEEFLEVQNKVRDRATEMEGGR